MKPAHSLHRLFLRLLLTSVLTSTACLAPLAGTPAGPATATTAAGPLEDTPTAPATPAPAETEVLLEPVFGPGEFDLTDLGAGLATLSSYTASLRQDFEGTQSGQPLQWSRLTIMRFIAEPAVRQVTVQQPDDATPRLFLAELQGVTYERRGEDPCTAALVSPGLSLADRFEPARSLSPLVGAEAAGAETVNGLPANRYTFDERALVLSGFAESAGEFWVASEGGYIVKYLLTTQAGPDYFGPEIEGTLSLAYELTAINETVAPEIPAGCPAGLLDVPLLPDAANVRSLPGMLRYNTAMPPTEAGAFYQESLSALGWTLADTALFTDTAALLDFSQGTGKLTISAKQGEAGTAVTIVQTR